jgi:DNA polymerase-1
MVHLYDPELKKKLEDRVKEDFGYEKKTFKELAGKNFDKVNWTLEGDELLELLAGYAGEDTYWETKLYYKYRDLLDEQAWRIHDKIELPLVRILRDAKIRGVQIDIPLLVQMNEQCSQELENCIREIYDEAGCVFNLNSPKQKQEVFFDKMHLPVISRTGSGQPATDSDTFSEWASRDIPIGISLERYSELNKLKSGYLDSIPLLVDKWGVLRGDLNSCGTETGRMSSSNPNLQNQPNNHDFPIRAAFIPRPGYVFVNYDYSQLELRVMAHMSHDKKFMQIFHEGRDPHGEVAQAVGITRKQAKVLNFGVLYGMGPDKYMKTFGVSRKEAEKMIEDYHRTYDGFARWKVATENFVRKNGYVRNLFGRMRRLPEATKDPYHRDNYLYYKALRQSVNTIIQGTGADIVKRATIAMCNEFVRRDLDAHFLLQVHDEVLIEVRADQMFEVEQVVIDCMQNTTKLDVPLIADGKILANWGEMKDDDVLSLPFRFDYSLYSGLL